MSQPEVLPFIRPLVIDAAKMAVSNVEPLPAS
jgi:hypothetical protein